MAIVCHTCKKPQSYPFIKVPLGPPEITSVAEAQGITVRKGLVLYSWFCLICAQSYLITLTEDFLSHALETKEHSNE